MHAKTRSLHWVCKRPSQRLKPSHGVQVGAHRFAYAYTKATSNLEFGALHLRDALLQSLGISVSASDKYLTIQTLEQIRDILASNRACDIRLSRNFLQVLASCHLLDRTSTVSFGTSVQRSIAALVIDRICVLHNPAVSFKDGHGRYMEGPKGIGKSTILRAMCEVVPVLAPSVLAVYVDANKIHVRGSYMYSLGNAVWSVLKDAPAVVACLGEHAQDFESRVASGERLWLSEDIVPALVAAGKKIVIVVDEAEEYFRVSDDRVQWTGDLKFFGDLEDMPAMGIVSGSSANLGYMMRGRTFLRAAYPKVRTNFNTSKISPYPLPVTDPNSLRIAGVALTHDLAKDWKHNNYTRALLMIGGGSNARHLVTKLLMYKQKDLLKSASQPFDVQDDYVYPPEAEDLWLAAHHLYHKIFIENMHLWEKSGVAKILVPGSSGSGAATAPGEVRPLGGGIIGSPHDAVKTNESSTEVFSIVSDDDGARAAEYAASSEKLQSAVDALARYIADYGSDWVNDFTKVSRDSLQKSFVQLQRYGGGLKLPRDASVGVWMLTYHRHLVYFGSSVTAPSLAHIIAAYEPSPQLITDQGLLPYVLSGDTVVQAEDRKAKAEGKKARMEEQYARAEEQYARREQANAGFRYDLLGLIAIILTIVGLYWAKQDYDSRKIVPAPGHGLHGGSIAQPEVGASRAQPQIVPSDRTSDYPSKNSPSSLASSDQDNDSIAPTSRTGASTSWWTTVSRWWPW